MAGGITVSLFFMYTPQRFFGWANLRILLIYAVLLLITLGVFFGVMWPAHRTLARVKADGRYAGMPFVLVSAAGDAATMEQALGLGADGYIVKPFDGSKVGVYLAQLAAGPDAAAAADEDPQATLQRLNIDAARLQLYLGGLQRQLDGAAGEIAGLLESGQLEAARARLARLQEGCATLGLHGAAAGLGGLLGLASLDLQDVRDALAMAQEAVLRRQAAAR